MKKGSNNKPSGKAAKKVKGDEELDLPKKARMEDDDEDDENFMDDDDDDFEASYEEEEEDEEENEEEDRIQYLSDDELLGFDENYSEEMDFDDY
ncbi:MAG: hypothetical protein H6585_00830 [Flavobacteriales bacterium]|nr:hypothetical protein [Flavobacteriales bacterium]MCB9446870.1 hypothetical protein [Flavobacteriales bacterium]